VRTAAPTNNRHHKLTKTGIHNFATPSLLLHRFSIRSFFGSEYNISYLISIRRKFLICACKVWTFHLHQSTTTLLKCNEHWTTCITYIEYLYVGKLEDWVCNSWSVTKQWLSKQMSSSRSWKFITYICHEFTIAATSVILSHSNILHTLFTNLFIYIHPYSTRKFDSN
jgi:hypothetical protein